MKYLSCWLLLGLFLQSACAPEPAGGPVEGSSWRLSGWQRADSEAPLRDSTGIVLSFSDEKVNGIGTCNNYFGNYSTEDGLLHITGLGATRKLCPGSMKLEQDYLELLRNAERYSVRRDELKIFSKTGALTFRRLSAAEEAALRRRRDLMRLDQLFASDLPQRPLHIYAAEYPNEVHAYPFEGTEIPYDLYHLFDAELAENWRDLGWGVYAIGKYQDKYLLRIPGRYTSDQIALYSLENGQMTYLTSVASKWCEENWCNQQDGWLRDLNDDNRFDLVTHYVQFDDAGDIVQEEINVRLQTTAGRFESTDAISIRPEDYSIQRQR